jgi:hypothetical protein
VFAVKHCVIKYFVYFFFCCPVTEKGESGCKLDDKTYKYDTCSMQQMLDYAIDSSGAVSTGTQKEKIIVATKTSQSPRNLIDPIKQEIATYETILKNIPNYETTLTFATTLSGSDDTKIKELKNFLMSYCKYSAGTAMTCVCVLLLQDLLQSCARGGRRRVEDM